MSSVVIAGDTSGSVTLQAPATAGSVVVTLPSVSGTMAVTGDSTSFNNLAYTGTLTGGTGVVNLGSGQFYKDASGNIGVGTTPSAFNQGRAIELLNTGYGLWNGTSSIYSIANTYFNSGFKYANTGEASTYYQFQGTHVWSNAPSGTAGNAVTFSERMRIDSSGNVGIGTSSPATRLDVSGASGFLSIVRSNTDAAVGQRFFRNGTNAGEIGTGDALFSGGSGSNFGFTTPSTNALLFGTNATERMRIDTAGVLQVGGIQTFNDGSLIVYANGRGWAGKFQRPNNGNMVEFLNNSSTAGAITVSGSTTAYVTSSDYRLKENVQPMIGALAKVAQLKPVTYTWKAEQTYGEGFIAHELAEVCPLAVVNDKDEVDNEGKAVYQGIDTSFLVATLTAAIQELNAKVEAQAAQIAALTGAK